MENGIHLSIVTPESTVLDAPVEYVGVPGTSGDFGVYPGHATLLSSLRTGCLTYKESGRTVNVFISGGFVDVTKESVTVLADVANPADFIDVARAEKSRERAEVRLADKADTLDLPRAEAALKRAIVRISMASSLEI